MRGWGKQEMLGRWRREVNRLEGMLRVEGVLLHPRPWPLAFSIYGRASRRKMENRSRGIYDIAARVKGSPWNGVYFTIREGVCEVLKTQQMHVRLWGFRLSQS
jgi:hypothetical protein